jgi:hypothetical protein
VDRALSFLISAAIMAFGFWVMFSASAAGLAVDLDAFRTAASGSRRSQPLDGSAPLTFAAVTAAHSRHIRIGDAASWRGTDDERGPQDASRSPPPGSK